MGTAMDINECRRTKRPARDGYLFSRGQAWFAFAMTIGLMMVDYIDRQVIVSLFPVPEEPNGACPTSSSAGWCRRCR